MTRRSRIASTIVAAFAALFVAGCDGFDIALASLDLAGAIIGVVD